MPTIGTIGVNLHTVDRDETVYARSANTVSHTDNVALRRTLPSKKSGTLRTQVRFERGFSVDGTSVEKPVTVSIAVTVAPGVDTTSVKAYITEALIEAAIVSSELAVSGDIHL